MNKEQIEKSHLRLVSVIAGTALIIMTFAAFFASGFVYKNLIVPSDISSTIRNIIESQSLFRAGLFGWLIIIVTDVVVAWAFFLFFNCTDNKLSLLSAWLRVLYACILAIAVSCLIFVNILSSAGFTQTMQAEYLCLQVMFFIDAFNEIWNWGLIIFGIHLLLTGIMAIRSDAVPTVMAIILIAASSSYLIVNTSYLLFFRYSRILYIANNFFKVPAMGEVVFGLWLLMSGGKNQYGKESIPGSTIRG